jgi:hypothetical protein
MMRLFILVPLALIALWIFGDIYFEWAHDFSNRSSMPPFLVLLPVFLLGVAIFNAMREQSEQIRALKFEITDLRKKMN